MRSYTEVVTYRRCPKRHYYSRVLNLEPIQMGWRPSFGTWMHKLHAARNLGGNWYTQHLELKEQFDAEVLPFTSDPEVLEIPTLAEAVMERYIARYPNDDWEILHVEESFDIDGIGITPDLVVRTGGGIYVPDYKTSIRIPQEWDLMADTQHLLYVGGVRKIYGPEVKGVIFDYARSKLPTPLRLNKKDGGKGPINNVARVDTDYDTLLDFAASNGIGPYPELTDRLAELQYSDPFFKRFAMLTPQEACDIAISEARGTATDMERAEMSGRFPRTVLPQSAGTASCNACAFKELCQAELFGLDTTSARMMYQERTPLNREYQEVST